MDRNGPQWTWIDVLPHCYHKTFAMTLSQRCGKEHNSAINRMAGEANLNCITSRLQSWPHVVRLPKYQGGRQGIVSFKIICMLSYGLNQVIYSPPGIPATWIHMLYGSRRNAGHELPYCSYISNQLCSKFYYNSGETATNQSLARA